MVHYHIWSWGLLFSVSWYSLLLLGSAFFLIRLLGTVARRWKTDWFEGSQRGSITIQFILLFPILISLFLVIFQTALIVQAKLVVNYAAFCAARSAIVVIPAAVRAASSGLAEDEGQIDTNNPGSPKMAIIRRAAALGCAGISPRWTADVALHVGETLNLAQVTNMAAVGAFFTPVTVAPGQNPLTFPADFASRAQYALAGGNTSILVATEHHPGSSEKASYQMVTVTVNYRYYLTVPFADRIFGTRYPGVLNWMDGAYYLPARETYTLLAEDDPTFPADQNQYRAFQVDSYQ